MHKGTLLGFECQTDAQCGMKVLNSGCVNGVCTCSMGFTAYRRHSCLPRKTSLYPLHGNVSNIIFEQLLKGFNPAIVG